MLRTALILGVAWVLMPASLACAQSALPLVEEVPATPLREHARRLREALETLKTALPEETVRALSELLREAPRDEVAFAAQLQKLLDPHCLVGVSINPESRVKAARGPAAAELRLKQPGVVLIKVHNDAGVTHALTVSGPQLRSTKETGEGQWLEAAVSSSPPLARTLSGHKLEYVLLRLTPHEVGKREATLRFDVGQGTQDLGFRAEVPVLFRIRER